MAFRNSRAYAMYRRLLSLYPQSFRQQMSEPMLQTFSDLYQEHAKQHTGTAIFLARTFTETLFGAIRENMLTIFNTHMTKHNRYALTGFILLSPAILMLLVGIFELHFIREALTLDSAQPNLLGLAIIYGGLAALPFALGITLWPMLKRGENGKRNFYIINSILALIITLMMIIIAVPFAKDIYRCDIQKIPNCD